MKKSEGLATEGCRAWIVWAKQTGSLKSLIANIHPDNTPSIGLAMKLGFVREREDTTPSGLPTLIYRLDIASG